MCGIAGIIKYGAKPIEEEQISLFLTGNEHRGNDATGMAFQQADGSIQVCKKDIPAWRFVCDDIYKDFIKEYLNDDTRAVILHTRGATQGSPRDNKNNHPMYFDTTAVVHNGCINNDDALFNNMKLERRAETDSDILRAILDEHGITPQGIRELSRVNGSAAGAAISSQYPGKVLIFRSGSPMTLGTTENYFVFSSEKNTIHRAMRPWIKRFGSWFQIQKSELAFSPMADNTAWIMGPEGFEQHVEFKALFGNYVEPWRRTYEGYSEREAKWPRIRSGCDVGSARVTVVSGLETKTEDASQLENAICPKCAHKWVITKGDDPIKYQCAKDRGGCGSPVLKFAEVK